jgi:hypothetical protein
MVSALSTDGTGAGLAAGGALAAGHAVGVFFGILELVVFASWALFFVVGFGLLIYITVLRGRRVRRKQVSPLPAAAADPNLPAQLARVRAADPHFDAQLLLDASQLISLIIFAAMSTGDESIVRPVVDPSFWSTFYGRYVRSSARSARLLQVQERGRREGQKHARFPVDYQAVAPELISLEFQPQQRACVRVSFSQLRAVVASGAARQTAMASATSVRSLAVGFGGTMADQMNNTTNRVPGLSWLGWAGKFDMFFIRPAGARTDPRSAISNRTCARCGATYRSELAASCAHCHAERPVAWDTWRLADITLVD